MRKLARRSLLGALCAALLTLCGAPAQAAFDDPLFIFDPNALPKPLPYAPFEGPCGVAVDSAGNLYVADYYHHQIDIFMTSTPLPWYITALRKVDPLDGPCGLALDTSGNLYVNNYHRNVEKFVPSSFPPTSGSDFPVVIPATTYASAGVINPSHPTGVAVDPASGNVYVNDRTHLSVYDSGGVSLGQIGGGTLQDGYGLARSSFPATAGRLYAPDAATDTVKVYDPPIDTENPVATIDGGATPLGEFVSLRDSAVAIDDVTGELYVADTVRPEYTDRPETVVYVFDASGAYEGRLKHGVISGLPVGLAVDNSPTATQGRVYLTSGNTENAVLYAYPPGAATSASVSPSQSGPSLLGGGVGGSAASGKAGGSAASPSQDEPSASASEIVQKGTLRVTVDGRLSPRALPRKGSAPISVSVGGEISTTDGSQVPRLETLAIELNREGHLDSAGLPTCPYSRIQPASTSRALSACRPALVGQGSFTAEITLTGQEPYPTKGRLLLFNGREGGRPVLFGQIYSPRPFATSFVIVFAIKRLPRGTFGTALEASLPEALGSWGNLTGIEMTLSRRYVHQGRPRSYLSAGCPAPKGFGAADFSLARASFGFEGGAKLTSTLSGTCKVRRAK
jgi:hypothetical protein